MRYFVYFAYQGTDFHGWQRQPNGTSVQEVMEAAWETVLRVPTPLTAAGRTDAGVHASQMVAHFDSEQELLDLPLLTARLNGLLPPSIAIAQICRVKDEAHARFDAISRRYEYRIIDHKDPFLNHFAARINCPLDFAKMNQAAQLLLTTTDFTSFCKVHTDAKTMLCQVSLAQWEQRGEQWVFVIEANRFLRNMVRAIVGTLFEVGRGRMSLEQFQAVVQAKDRCQAAMSAPAEGLYLVKIDYPASLFEP